MKPDVQSVSLGLRWTGASWNKVATPNPGGTTGIDNTTTLAAVSAISATDAWSVGSFDPQTAGTVAKSLILQMERDPLEQGRQPKSTLRFDVSLGSQCGFEL